MEKPRSTPRKIFNLISPFMMAGILVVLLPIFGVMTLDRMEKQKEHIQEQLLGRGISLIRTFEAGTRTGMLTMGWGVRRIQAMLQETAGQPDIEYLMITSRSGEILAHSDPDMVGKSFEAMPDIAAVQEDTLLVGHRKRQDLEPQVFEVYKRFAPLAMGFRGRHKFMRHMEPQMPGNETQFSDKAEHYIFAGLSMARASLAQDRLVKETIGRGVLFFIMGCIGMISLFAFQAYRSAKASLTRVKAFSDNVVQNMPAGLMTIDLDHGITSMNRTAEKILGQIPEKPFPQMIELVNEMETLGAPVSREIILEMGESSELRLDMTASPILDDQEIVLGFLFLFRDLTQLKALKKKVETTRHLAAIGKLAGGVAHEIRNPLSSIKGFATYFGKRYEENPDDREIARIMVQEVERINRSITQLLEFAKPLAVENKEVTIDALISHSLKLVQQDLDKKSIKAVVSLKTDKVFFTTDPDRINQVLLNLYMNAIHAMEPGGKLGVKVLDAPDKNGLEIHVSDNGCGIDKKHLDDVFDPYFTTRANGTGLGLSIVHRIIENLKGEIQVESEKNQGTCFMIRLPGHLMPGPGSPARGWEKE